MSALPSAAVLARAANDGRLTALSFGVRVPAQGCAAVHSIFAGAVNIELPGKRLLVLLRAECPNVPHGIRIAAAAWPRLHSCLRVGDVVHLEPGRLTFCRGDLDVDLSTASLWHLRVAGRSIDWSDARVIDTFTTAYRALHRPAAFAADSAAALYSRRLACVLPCLERALVCLRVHEAGEQLQRLLGLGPGLTPSGDDFIIGCLAGLALSMGDARPRTQFLAKLCRQLEHQLDATTPISRQHLSDACRLQFAQPLAELALALAAGARDVPAKLSAALRIGAYSGADGVRGLLFASQAWRARPTAIACHDNRARRLRRT
jgi:Protein of unknown function (DUF2877)